MKPKTFEGEGSDQKDVWRLDVLHESSFSRPQDFKAFSYTIGHLVPKRARVAWYTERDLQPHVQGWDEISLCHRA
ncbi:hypothetical protein CsatB_024428 [Cannabis sativa]